MGGSLWLLAIEKDTPAPLQFVLNRKFGGGEIPVLIFSEDSLVGLALDSATRTCSGLGRGLCNAGPHPGTTWNYKTGGIIHQLIEQPGHADFLGCSRAIVKSGGLRRKTQLFSFI
ncbi:hypothetical protein TNCV_3610411 [Trichonephila clavipes]|nr:hypothetical protein TNCV_3610411 [Trichonephila clavipes]